MDVCQNCGEYCLNKWVVYLKNDEPFGFMGKRCLKVCICTHNGQNSAAS